MTPALHAEIRKVLDHQGSNDVTLETVSAAALIASCLR